MYDIVIYYNSTHHNITYCTVCYEGSLANYTCSRDHGENNNHAGSDGFTIEMHMFQPWLSSVELCG